MKSALIFISLSLALTVYPQQKKKPAKSVKPAKAAASPCSSKLLKDSPKLRGLQLGMNIGDVSMSFPLEAIAKKSGNIEDQKDIVKAEYNVSVDEVMLNSAKREQQRQMELFEKGVVSKLELEEVDGRVKEAQRSLNVTKIRLNELKAELEGKNDPNIKMGRVTLDDAIFELEFDNDVLAKVMVYYSTDNSRANVDDFLSVLSGQLKLRGSWTPNPLPIDNHDMIKALNERIDKMEKGLHWLRIQETVDESEVAKTKSEISKLRLERASYIKPIYFERTLKCSAFNMQAALPKADRPLVLLSRSAYQSERAKSFKP